MPRVKTTPMVKVALYGLRIYLIVLLVLIGMKFVRSFVKPGAGQTRPTTTAPATASGSPTTTAPASLPAEAEPRR